jgi:hypothetical protein
MFFRNQVAKKAGLDCEMLYAEADATSALLSEIKRDATLR